MKYSLYILSIAFFFIQCGNKQNTTQPTKEEANLGEIEFDVTGSEEAAPFFHDGLLLLHSFEFEDAAEKFVEAQRIDSNFVMAYWGEAMSYNHPLWRERYTEEGVAALMKLAETPQERLAMAKTPLERDLLQAVEILYAEGDKKEQDIAYKDKMEELHKQYPEHHEVAAFYALSLLGSSKSRKEDDHYERGAKIVQGIIAENPQHPGALHYLIHSYDDPDHATLALDAANRYSKVAPDAEHALHMPSHIFVALGMWDEVIKSNIASYDASVVRMKEKELDSDARGYHAFKWLMYGYLQKGNFEKAREMVYDMKQYCDENPSSRARAHYIMMKADYLTESGNWEDSIANVNVELDKLNLLTKGVQVFTQGMSGYENGNIDDLNTAINELKDMQSKAESQMVIGSPKMCSGISSYMQPPSINEVNSVKVLECELQAMLALYNKDEKTAEKWMQEATLMEDKTAFTYGPPNIVKPSFELYGEWLLDQNRKEEAKDQFQKVLERAPKRRLAMKGMSMVNT
jgi:pentatricopeptide repeat protein